MRISVIIPTYQRPAKAAACVAALARQSLDPGEFEVLVGVDGFDQESMRACEHAAGRTRLLVDGGEKLGQAGVRNRLLSKARGEILVCLNDDMIPEPGFLASHAEAQREERGAIIVGSSPWAVREPDRLFDRLLRETSMVFFYHLMDEARHDRGRDWGYRHAWSLNLSVPSACVRDAGGFTVFPSTYGFEDDELAFRLREKFSLRVLYRPECVATHDHRMSPREYLEREYKLGFAAWGVARTTPRFAVAMFSRDLTDAGELRYTREHVERERAHAARALALFEESAGLPSSLGTGEHGRHVVALAYQQHLPLKRWCWRRGLLDAGQGREMSPRNALQELLAPATLPRGTGVRPVSPPTR